MDDIFATIKYHLIEPLSKIHADKLYQDLDACLCIYKCDGNTVKKIQCDQKFVNIMYAVKDDLGVHMNYTSVG